MPGTVIRVHVHEGSTVKAGQPLVVLEAMKMETPLTAPYDAVVRQSTFGKVIASRAARCWSTWASALALAGLAAGCGSTWQARFEPSGVGKNQFWVSSHGKPKAVVVLLHGLGQDSGSSSSRGRRTSRARATTSSTRVREPAPRPGRAQQHRRRRPAGGRHARTAGRAARPGRALAGGRLAVEAAAALEPRLVVAFYPGQINPQFEPATNFKLIPKTTSIYLLVGDRDTSVGNSGALELAGDSSPSASPHRASTAASSSRARASRQTTCRSTP